MLDPSNNDWRYLNHVYHVIQIVVINEEDRVISIRLVVLNNQLVSKMKEQNNNNNNNENVVVLFWR